MPDFKIISDYKPTGDQPGAIDALSALGVVGAAQELARRMGKQLEASMRGVVSEEIRKAMRPGNALNARGW
jgi:excinuclease UvrABC helicase subunit UvrB